MKRLATSTIIIFGALHLSACAPLHSELLNELRPSAARRRARTANSTSSRLARILMTATSAPAERPQSSQRSVIACASSRSPTASGAPRLKAAAHSPHGAAPRRRRPDAASASTTSSSTTTTASCCRRSTFRQQIIRQIRQWNADLVLAPRPNDYHPDHRYTGVLVQDAAYMVTCATSRADCRAAQESRVHVIPGRLPEAGSLQSGIAISIDDVIEKKIDVLDAHVSQMYEWLPWVAGNLEPVPKARRAEDVAAARRVRVNRRLPSGPAWRNGTVPPRETPCNAEAFEICEYQARGQTRR